MIEIIIFYLLFRTTLVIGFVLGYLVRGLLHLHRSTQLIEQHKKSLQEKDYHSWLQEVKRLYNVEIN